MPYSSRVAIVFPGQGSQFVGMGHDLYEHFKAAKSVFETADEALDFPLSQLCFDGPLDELTQTVNVQPAIVTVSLALLAVVQEKANGLEPAFVAGHSLGEYTALAAAGVLDTAGTILLARKRGELMQQASLRSPGGMAAILGLADEAVLKIADEAHVYIANYNCPGQVVISGEKPKLARAMELATARGASRVVLLQVSGAFHTAMMNSALKELSEFMDGLSFAKPSIPIVANTSARPLASARAVKQELIEQMCHAVRWQESIEFMLAHGVDTFVEIGPGQVISGLVKRISREAKTVNIGDAQSAQEFLEGGQVCGPD